MVVQYTILENRQHQLQPYNYNDSQNRRMIIRDNGISATVCEYKLLFDTISTNDTVLFSGRWPSNTMDSMTSQFTDGEAAGLLRKNETSREKSSITEIRLVIIEDEASLFALKHSSQNQSKFGLECISRKIVIDNPAQCGWKIRSHEEPQVIGESPTISWHKLHITIMIKSSKSQKNYKSNCKIQINKRGSILCFDVLSFIGNSFNQTSDSSSILLLSIIHELHKLQFTN